MSAHEDLRDLCEASDQFFTVALPAPSDQIDSDHRFAVEWTNARRELAPRWDDVDLQAIDDLLVAVSHRDGAALIVVRGKGGPSLAEFLAEPVQNLMVHEGPVPRLAPLIEARSRVIAHVVVETDRAGADLTAFDGTTVTATKTVEGDTEHIHRGQSGGWSQARFQQRAENTWEHNANDVADAVADLARQVDARLIAVSGDVRAQTFVLESLPQDVSGIAVKIEAGSPEGIADEVVRLLADQVASHVVELADRFRTAQANGPATSDTATTLDALAEGRVDTLLVHDDGSTEPTIGAERPELPSGARVVDAAIAAALRTDATVVVVPRLALLDGPIAALLRW